MRVLGAWGRMFGDQSGEQFFGDNAVPTSIGLAAHLAVAHLERRGIDPAPLLALSGLSQAAVASHKRLKVKR